MYNLLLLVRLILKIYFSLLLKHYFTLSKVIFLTLFFCNKGLIIFISSFNTFAYIRITSVFFCYFCCFSKLPTIHLT